MRQAADAGHRVILVTATDGAVGEYPEGLLAEGESLASRRRRELSESARVLGVQRIVMFGYADSGMAGTAENSNPLAFMNIEVEEPAQRLADVLMEERADLLTTYDSNGGYGHPDHIQVHHVGLRAAEIAGTAHVYESVTNRDHMQKMIRANPQWSDEDASLDLSTIGLPDEDITTEVDVKAFMEAKRAAMVAHATQIGDFGPFLAMTSEQLDAVFGVEWFRRVRGAEGPRERSLPL